MISGACFQRNPLVTQYHPEDITLGLPSTSYTHVDVLVFPLYYVQYHIKLVHIEFNLLKIGVIDFVATKLMRCTQLTHHHFCSHGLTIIDTLTLLINMHSSNACTFENLG